MHRLWVIGVPIEGKKIKAKKRGEATSSCALVAAVRVLLTHEWDPARVNRPACFPNSESRERGRPSSA